ncbi:MAG: signal peptidase I [Bilifractor sp.]|jgi:signal peptidase I
MTYHEDMKSRQPNTEGKSSNSKTVGRYGTWKRWLQMLIQYVVIFAIGLTLLFRFVVGVARVSGNSMDPTYHNGQTVWFNRLDHAYQAGDVVCFRLPTGELLVKRVIAVGGDTVDLQDGKVLVNGKPLDESAYAHGRSDEEEGEVSYPYKVPEGSYFVMGDNREHSADSRSFKAIVGAAIKGKLFGA